VRFAVEKGPRSLNFSWDSAYPTNGVFLRLGRGSLGSGCDGLRFGRDGLRLGRGSLRFGHGDLSMFQKIFHRIEEEEEDTLKSVKCFLVDDDNFAF
jgi:hypothetical protein